MSETVTRRGFLKATGSVASVVAIAGCSGSESPGASTGNETNSNGNGNKNGTDSTDTGSTGGTLNLINATITTLDPIASADTASGTVIRQMFDGLMQYPNGEVPVEPVLAKDVQLSKDYRTYTFTLKQGAKFHNGKEVTADDFVYAFERMAASDNSQVSGDILRTLGVVHEKDTKGDYVPGSMAVKAPERYTLTMTLEAPFHATLQVLSNYYFSAIPEGIIGDIPGYKGKLSQGTFATKNPIGAGPFKFEAWQSGTEAAVTAFKNYHGKGPKVDGVHWQVIEKDEAVYNYAMNKNVGVFNLPTAHYTQSKRTVERTDKQGRKFGTYGPLRNGETVNYLGVTTLSISYLGFNMPVVPKPVRQAVAYVLNQHTVTENTFKGRGIPAYHYMIPGVYPGGAEAATQHAKQKYPYGYNKSMIGKAKQVMEEAGYGPSNPFEFTLTIYKQNTWASVAKLLRSQLRAAHINMKITQAPFATLVEQVHKLNVDAFSLGWAVPWASADAFVKHLNPKLSDPTTRATAELYANWPHDTESAQRGIKAWETIQENAVPTKEAKQARLQAAVEMEEANWEAVASLPVYHEMTERFSYDWVDIPPFGIAGPAAQNYNTVTVDK